MIRRQYRQISTNDRPGTPPDFFFAGRTPTPTSAPRRQKRQTTCRVRQNAGQDITIEDLTATPVPHTPTVTFSPRTSDTFKSVSNVTFPLPVSRLESVCTDTPRQFRKPSLRHRQGLPTSVDKFPELTLNLFTFALFKSK